MFNKITENLALLLSDTVVKLLFSMKTSVDKYACHDILENCPEKWVHTIDLSRTQPELVMRSLDDTVLSLRLHIWRTVLFGVDRWTHTPRKGGGGGGWGSYGIFNLKKVSNFTI